MTGLAAALPFLVVIAVLALAGVLLWRRGHGHLGHGGDTGHGGPGSPGRRASTPGSDA